MQGVSCWKFSFRLEICSMAHAPTCKSRSIYTKTKQHMPVPCCIIPGLCYKIQGDIVTSAIVMVMYEETGMAKITYEGNIPPSHIQNIILTKIWPMDDFLGFRPAKYVAYTIFFVIVVTVDIVIVIVIDIIIYFLWIIIINIIILLPSPSANILELINRKGNLIKFALKLGTLSFNAPSIYLRIYGKRRCVHPIWHSHNGGHQSLAWKHTSR